jgi:hypothetical protein
MLLSCISAQSSNEILALSRVATATPGAPVQPDAPRSSAELGTFGSSVARANHNAYCQLDQSTHKAPLDKGATDPHTTPPGQTPPIRHPNAYSNDYFCSPVRPFLGSPASCTPPPTQDLVCRLLKIEMSIGQ